MPFFKYDDPMYGGKKLCPAYAVDHLLEALSEDISFFDRLMRSLGGDVLAIDGSFKNVPKVRLKDGSLAMDGIQTFMNEYKQVVAMYMGQPVGRAPTAASRR